MPTKEELLQAAQAQTAPVDLNGFTADAPAPQMTLDEQLQGLKEYYQKQGLTPTPPMRLK